MNHRYITTTVDTLFGILRDYVGADVPEDAKLIRVMHKPTDAGKLAFVIDSDSIPYGAEPLQVRFDLKRIHTL